MNLRRLHQWFALPDAARSPWKRRLVWGAPFVLVLSGLVIWKVSRPVLGEDVKLEEVSREEAGGTDHERDQQSKAGGGVC